MEKFEITYHPKIKAVDIPRLGSFMSKQILSVVYKKLGLYPAIYGLALRSPLKGLWKLRVGNYRVIYEVLNKKVIVQVIGHRKEVYQIALKRLGLN